MFRVRDLAFRIQNRDRFQFGTAGECIISDRSDILRNGHGFQGCIAECPAVNSCQAVRQLHVVQPGAAVKCIGIEHCQLLRQDHRIQPLAAAEGMAADARTGFRQRNRVQLSS